MLEILYEDNHVLVAIKPPNMLSQADSTGDTDLLSIVREYIRVNCGKPGNVYIGLVHRLDRPVGGLMVFARTSKAASRLSAQMRDHRLGRSYLCVAQGNVPDSFTRIDWLLKDERLNRVSVVPPSQDGAQRAVLHGRCLARENGHSLCAITLETGRSHQIRVQMANMHAPLWGDNRYGNGIPGQQIALWGYLLRFEHPTTHRVLTFLRMPSGGVWTRFHAALESEESTLRRVQISPEQE